MSTATSRRGGSDGPGAAARSEAGRSADLSAGPNAVDFSIGALAAETADFAGTFERWEHRKAVEAGASVPRLRLLYSLHCNGPQKMADLADELAVTPRNVTALVDGLEAERLVRRVPHSTDRRVTLIELTCNSDRVAAQFRAYQASIEGLLAALDDGDQRTLLRLLEILHDRMNVEAGSTTSGQEASDA